jgi:hypothetical protein
MISVYRPTSNLYRLSIFDATCDGDEDVYEDEVVSWLLLVALVVCCWCSHIFSEYFHTTPVFIVAKFNCIQLTSLSTSTTDTITIHSTSTSPSPITDFRDINGNEPTDHEGNGTRQSGEDIDQRSDRQSIHITYG